MKPGYCGMGTPEQNAAEEAHVLECMERDQAEKAARIIWREKHVPSPRDYEQAHEATMGDIRSSDPVLGAFMTLADQVKAMASAIETIAWELDRERRGKLSAAARQDADEVRDTVLDLVRSPHMPQKARRNLIEELQEHLAVLQLEAVTL